MSNGTKMSSFSASWTALTPSAASHGEEHARARHNHRNESNETSSPILLSYLTLPGSTGSGYRSALLLPACNPTIAPKAQPAADLLLPILPTELTDGELGELAAGREDRNRIA